MNTQHRPTPAHRDLAVNRLGQLTAGVAVAGFAAVGGLGYLAALHDPGTSVDSSVAAAVTNALNSSTTTTDDSTTSVSDTETSSSSSGLQSSSSGVSSSSGSGQVTTGGS